MHNSSILAGHCITTLRGASVDIDDCMFSNMTHSTELGSLGGATCVNVS